MSFEKGLITPMVLVIVTVSAIIMFSLAFVVVNQYQLTQRTTALEQARQIAESGLDYYRWRLAHFPDDFQDGTGQAGPYLHDFYNPEGEIVGQYQLTITPPNPGYNIFTISSTGWNIQYPTAKETVSIQYGTPSMAEYALLYNNDIWLPPGFTINGPVHANGGIRNDGINTSNMSSALSTYLCTQKNGGCTPPTDKPGIWGDGGDEGLWIYPAPRIDFDAINIDYVFIKSEAQSRGLYLNPSNKNGYHLVFNPNGSYSVYLVSQVDNFKGGKGNPGCDQLYGTIKTESLVGTYQQSSTPIIFAEDNLWVQGTITSPLTVTAAKFPIDTQNADIWINENFNYSTTNGTIQAGLIAQHDVIIHRDVPTDFILHGAILAQTGSLLRHDYGVSCAGSPENSVRNSFTFYGSLISAQQSQWNWGTSMNSGFVSGTITYDTNLRKNPPPYFPSTSQYQIIDWAD